MGVRRRNAALTPAVVGIVAAGSKIGTVRSQEIQQAKDQQQVQDKISRALSAGPDNITKDATVAEPDGHGGLTVLRQGTNDFTCIPGDANEMGMPRWAPTR